jgi:hypothetical protein
MNMWFRYERDFARRWCPVVHYGELPRTPKDQADRLTTPIPVPPDCLDTAGEPMFGRLQAIFPAPRDET